ncbi:hypothetical protein BD324DRAFT_678907 [Kockovaella imperatae]|uniref:S-adenosyl-L-methionine-dependent methyltransferase n=1 Tax=Kockovaella imperatae TaxID=4999 RepID=A0A1Y1UQR2_9TREE|nr:hypothetical protein BD324DRAFT_678907 [Kockovaella imperatae]ORX39814.1 hypothetical protein BD324DRAFT_678907 [Kockovaella imperatae]
MHPLSRYARAKPDFKRLGDRCPELAPFVKASETGYAAIDFADPAALRALTKALLKHDWDLDVDLRDDRLCPTISNRLDYALSVLDLEPFLNCIPGSSSTSKGPSQPDRGHQLRILDIGTGHIAVYPLLLHRLRSDAAITGTDVNDISLQHAQSILERNQISKESIKLLRADSNGDILFALRDQSHDIVMCNPPFYASEEEMKQNTELKNPSNNAVVTAAANESICPGGEVDFVSRMISESTRLSDKAQWFTSLIGKYSSLTPLVDLIKSFKIDNYFIKSIKQAKTSRWIIGWSYSEIRLPDSLTLPETIMPNTSYARLLPAPNRLTHRPLQPPLAIELLRETMMPVLLECQLDPNSSAQAEEQEDGTLNLSPRGNTWSRAARRQAARENAQNSMAIDEKAPQVAGPVIRMRLSFLPPTPLTSEGTQTQLTDRATGDSSHAIDDASSEPAPASTANGDSTGTTSQGATLALDWLQGKDRALFESFWKFLLTKGNLLGKQGGSETAGGEKRSAAGPDSHAGRDAGSGGNRGGFRGRIRIGFAARGTRGGGGSRGRGEGRDSGWGRDQG